MDESEDLRDQDAVVQVFFIRDGKLIGRDHFFISGWQKVIQNLRFFPVS